MKINIFFFQKIFNFVHKGTPFESMSLFIESSNNNIFPEISTKVYFLTLNKIQYLKLVKIFENQNFIFLKILNLVYKGLHFESIRFLERVQKVIFFVFSKESILIYFSL